MLAEHHLTARQFFAGLESELDDSDTLDRDLPDAEPEAFDLAPYLVAASSRND